MIARVSLSWESFSELSAELAPQAARALHESLLKMIEAHAVLVAGNDAEMRDLAEAARALNQPVGKKWRTLLEEFKKRNRVRAVEPPVTGQLADGLTLSELIERCGGRSDVVVLPTARAAALGIDETHGLLWDERHAVELATPTAAPYCSTIERLRETAEVGHLAFGCTRESFWSEVLRPIAELSRRIFVVDRYLFQQAMWHAHTLPRSRSREPTALCWLLECLDAAALSGSEVVVIGGTGEVDQPGDTAQAVAALLKLWSPRPHGRLAAVTIIGAPWKQSRTRMPHDRHISSNLGVAVKLHPGLDRLDRECVSDPDGMSWQYLWHPGAFQEVKRAEARVLRSPSAKSHVLLRR